jgi:hypothetical protein
LAVNAQGAQVGLDVVLRDVIANGTVDLNGAHIGGQLSCRSARLIGGNRIDGSMQFSLQAQGTKVEESFFLGAVTTEGTVDLTGATIGGQLDFEGATLDGGKDAEGDEQSALLAQRMRVKQSFFFCRLAAVRGAIDLTAAHVGDLVDDDVSWPEAVDDLVLDGLVYDRIAGPTTFASRKAWLANGSHWGGEFYPQPYTQFARTLRQMGHAAEARKVLIGMADTSAKIVRNQNRDLRRFARAFRWFSASESQLTWERTSERFSAADETPKSGPSLIAQQFKKLHQSLPDVSGAPAPLSDLTLSYARLDFRNQMRWVATKCRLAILWSYLKTSFLSILVGHGYAPHRAILVLLGTVGLSALCFAYAYCEGAMVPNSDVVLTSFSWWWSMQFDASAPTAGWTATGTATHYETFYALAYAFDVVVPLVDIGQKSAWSATTVTWLGWATRILTMALEVWGWIITALGAAAITGLVQRNQPD